MSITKGPDPAIGTVKPMRTFPRPHDWAGPRLSSLSGVDRSAQRFAIDAPTADAAYAAIRATLRAQAPKKPAVDLMVIRVESDVFKLGRNDLLEVVTIDLRRPCLLADEDNHSSLGKEQQCG